MAKQQSPSRAALAEAVANLQSAERALKDAKDAAANAQRETWAARDKAEELRERPVPQADANSLIAGLASGDVDVMTLDRPQAAARAALEAAEQKAAVWQSARELAAQAVPIRESALGWAKMKADAAARELVRAEVHIDKLLDEAKATAAQLLAQRAVLRAVQSALDPMSPEAKAIDAFLAPIPADCFNGAASTHPAAQPWRMAFKMLVDHPDTPLPG